MEFTKLHALPHVRGGALMAIRGHAMFLQLVQHMLATTGSSDFDVLKRDMPEVLKRAFPVFLGTMKKLRAADARAKRSWRALFRSRKDAPSDWTQDLVLVG